MIITRPCFGCLTRKDCDLRRSVTKSLRGLPVVNARIKCNLPFTRDFPPGTRAKVMVWNFLDCDEPDAEMRPATVIGPSSKKPGKALLYLDEPALYANDTKQSFVTAWPKNLQKLDEPARVLCGACRLPMADGECCENKDCRED